MKTTLVLEDGLVARLKAEAAQQKRTMSDLVDEALRRMLESPPAAADPLSELPRFSCGSSRVDLADRDALYQAMEGR